MFFIVPTFAFVNRLRGAGAPWFPGSRYWAPIAWGFFTALLLPHDSIELLAKNWGASALLFFLWSVWGWSQYFCAFSGQWSARNGIPLITALGLKLFPDTGNMQINRVRGEFCMFLRGLFILPLFLFVGWRLHHVLWYAAGGVGAAGWMGIIYYNAQRLADFFGGRKDPIEAAEFFTGLVFGFYLWA